MYIRNIPVIYLPKWVMFTHTSNFAIYFIYKRPSNSFTENDTWYYNFADFKWPISIWSISIL